MCVKDKFALYLNPRRFLVELCLQFYICEDLLHMERSKSHFYQKLFFLTIDYVNLIDE